MEETTTIDDSSSSCALFHDPSYAKLVSASFTALITCMQQHKKRQCRILACKTLALLARSAYARIRHSPYIYALRDPVLHRLEDEVGTDVPAALVTTALDDADDGVSATAVEALGIMTLSSSYTTGTLVEDELQREIRSISFGTVAPYAPTLRAVVDEDPSIPQAELQTRIYENILSPRLLQLVDRILRYPETAWICKALPLLTASLVHQVQTMSFPSTKADMDRSTYSQRWSEVNVAGLVDTVVNAILIPALQHHLDGALAKTAALSGLRLAQACSSNNNNNNAGGASWVTPLARSIAETLHQELLHTTVVEDQLASLAAMVIALRAVPLPERTPWLLTAAEYIYQFVPATTAAPLGIASAGLLLEWQGIQEYRRPARMGLWTELALSFFLDGPVPQQTTRADCLRSFLTNPLISSILTQDSNSEESATLSPRPEILLAFTTVAVDSGRRFRLGPDGNVSVSDPRAPAVDEWRQLAWVILTSFVSCVHLGPNPIYLEENLPLITAGQASYVQLIQEYLHTIGLLQTSCSVAVKLTTNACPPHILWDRMAESAALLARIEPFNLGGIDQTTRLMDEIVARERKQGVPSHHMRLFLLALAADQWVQCRFSILRHGYDEASSNSKSPLNVQSGRDIVMALSPKRLLAKMFAAHVPLASNTRRDPIKKLALETVRMCVACTENIALTAICWKRRFGSGGSSDAKKLVSTAVGVLQGKLDETPADDNTRAVMGPLCEAAVRRIQAFYEGEGGGAEPDEFPLSELVLQPGKTKIKPLISSTKPPLCPKDVYMRAYLMELSRQIVASRTEQAVLSFAPADTLHSPARPVVNWLRLAVPPVPESRDGRVLGNFGAPLAAWDNSVESSSTASDAAQLVLTYSPRRYLRYDGEDQFRIGVTLRIFNMTAIDFLEGIRLELGVSCPQVDLEDPVSVQSAESLGSTITDLTSDAPLVSATVVYRNEVKSGEHLTWEISISSLDRSNPVDLMPSVVYRNIKVEPDDVGTKWVGDSGGAGGGGGETSTTGAESRSGEDDFQVTNTQKGGSDKGEEAQTDNVRVVGAPLPLSPLVGLQPCPLVFFRDRWGDAETFRFMWFRMPQQMSPLRVGRPSQGQSAENPEPTAQKIAAMSRLRWAGEAIPGGFAAKAWAFSSQGGRRVLCIFAESDGDGGPGKQALYFRGDCKSLLYGLVGSKTARDAVVAAIIPGMIPMAR